MVRAREFGTSGAVGWFAAMTVRDQAACGMGSGAFA
jgi:hypothetical protein